MLSLEMTKNELRSILINNYVTSNMKITMPNTEPKAPIRAVQSHISNASNISATNVFISQVYNI